MSGKKTTRKAAGKSGSRGAKSVAAVPPPALPKRYSGKPGFRCPRCGSLSVALDAKIFVTMDCIEHQGQVIACDYPEYQGDYEYPDNFHAWCCECDLNGTVKQFREAAARPKEGGQ